MPADKAQISIWAVGTASEVDSLEHQETSEESGADNRLSFFCSNQAPDHQTEQKGIILEVYRIQYQEAWMQRDRQSDDPLRFAACLCTGKPVTMGLP
jgi:hypothetical protein